MNTAARTLALNVARRRAAKGMVQSELATAAGLTQPIVSRIENARYNPTVKTMAKLAVALDCTIADLLRPTKYYTHDLQTWRVPFFTDVT